jgi:hypothetical protein
MMITSQLDDFSLDIGIDLKGGSTFQSFSQFPSPTSPVKEISFNPIQIPSTTFFEPLDMMPTRKDLLKVTSSHLSDRKASINTIATTIGFEDNWSQEFKRRGSVNTSSTSAEPEASSSKILIESQPTVRHVDLDGFKFESRIGPIRTKESKKSTRLNVEINRPSSKKATKEVLNPPGGPGDLFSPEEEARLLHNHKLESDSKVFFPPLFVCTCLFKPLCNFLF